MYSTNAKGKIECGIEKEQSENDSGARECVCVCVCERDKVERKICFRIQMVVKVS